LYQELKAEGIRIMRVKIVLLIATAIITLTAFAASPDLVVNKTEDASVFTISYTSVEKGTVKIMLFDKKKTLIHSEILLNISSFVRPYDFHGLAKGKYTIVVESNNNKQVEIINYLPKRK
jgi:hypothetical protein